ncbi:MAG: ribosome-associated translation inhibitor RaiA [Proteobacteria bacterium]|nr:ribosome-associated translation inhibitor RaiA [Pseudomonadota bacterium]
MQMLITGKKMEVGDTLRAQAEERVRDVCQKYDLSPLETVVTFSKEGSPFHNMIRCDLEMHLGRGVYMRAHEETDEPHVSLEQAMETFEKRLRRYKGKLLDYKQKREASAAKTPASQYIINPENERESQGDNPLVIAEVKTDIPTLSVSEAVMHLDLSDVQAMLFNNVKDDQLNVVYRRPDGNIGWIAPSQNS